MWIYMSHFSYWLGYGAKMKFCLNALSFFGVFNIFFAKTNATKEITSCDGSYETGQKVFVNFNKINSPCTCLVTSLFHGDLLVTAHGKEYSGCPNKSTVNASVAFMCDKIASFSFKVHVSDILIITGEFRDDFTSGVFQQCLELKDKSNNETSFVTVKCGDSTKSTEDKVTTINIKDHDSLSTTTLPKSTSPATKAVDSAVTSITHLTTSEVENVTPIITTAENPPNKSTFADSKNMEYIIAGVAAGGTVTLILVVAIAIIVLQTRRKKQKAQKGDDASEHTNRAFDENYGLPENPLYHSAQPMDEVGYSSVQKNQLGLPPTEATIKKNKDPKYDVPTNNKPINDSDTSSMQIYAVPNKSRASAHEENEPQAMYAQVSKPSKNTTQGPMQSTNQDGLVYLEVEKDAPSVNENISYNQTDNKVGVSYAEIKRN